MSVTEILIHNYFQFILSVSEEVISSDTFSIHHTPRSSSKRFTKQVNLTVEMVYKIITQYLNNHIRVVP